MAADQYSVAESRLCGGKLVNVCVRFWPEADPGVKRSIGYVLFALYVRFRS